jgi:hypothetical protein
LQRLKKTASLRDWNGNTGEAPSRILKKASSKRRKKLQKLKLLLNLQPNLSKISDKTAKLKNQIRNPTASSND